MKYLQDSEDAKAIKKVRPSSSVTLLSPISLQPVLRHFLGTDMALLSVFFCPEFHELTFVFCHLFFAESQTSGGETQERENKPQPGEPEDSAAAATGKGLRVQVFSRTRRHETTSTRSWGTFCLTRFFFCHRRKPNAGWRKRRYWSTRSSSCRTPPHEERRAPRVVSAVQARGTASRTASPAACRGRLGSWALTGKACCLDPLWMPLLPRASPIQTPTLAVFRREPTSTLPPAPFFSETHPGLFSSC